MWNFVLTFADEVRFIWLRSSWDLARVFFLCVRYGPLACFIYNVYGAFWLIVSVCGADVEVIYV